MIQPKRYRRKPTEGSFVEFTEEIRALAVDREAIVLAQDAGVRRPFLRVRPGYSAAEVWNELHQSWIRVKVGDFIRVDVEGDVYPVDQVTFESTYEPIPE